MWDLAAMPCQVARSEHMNLGHNDLDFPTLLPQAAASPACHLTGLVICCACWILFDTFKKRQESPVRPLVMIT